MNLSFKYTKEDVGYLSEKKLNSIDLYLKIRKKENRILNDEEVILLPDTISSNPNKNKWKLRKKSAVRFIKYLQKKTSKLIFLDLRCGNGWFTNMISNASIDYQVIGIDVNAIELEQAARVFKNKHVQFVDADINEKIQIPKLDIIVLNASSQYFPDLKKTISTLDSYLMPKGEIHIIDSPFYKKNEIKQAKKRTLDYYTNLGFPEMTNCYYYHSFDNLVGFEILYNPKRIGFNKLIGKMDSPFYWFKKSYA